MSDEHYWRGFGKCIYISNSSRGMVNVSCILDTKQSGRKKFGSTNQLRISTVLQYEMFLYFRDTRPDMRCPLISLHPSMQQCRGRKRESGVQCLAAKCEN